MKTKILIVDDTFSIQNRGLVICGRKTDEFVDFRIGSLIEIQTSENSVLQTFVRGLDLFSRSLYNDKIICFLTDKNVEKSDVPKGAAVWLLNNDD